MSSVAFEPSSEPSLAPSLEDELAEVAGVTNAQHARIVEITVRALDTQGWRGAGVLSAAHWLTVQLGVAPGLAHRIVAVAGKIVGFPVLRATFRRGELSLDQVYEVATKAPEWADEFITEFATNCTVRQLRRMIRDQHFEGDPDEPEPAAIDPEREHVSFGWDEHSQFVLSARGAADRGMLFQAAINEARDALFRAGNTDVTWWDALDEMARRSLSVASPKRRERFKTCIHIHTDTGAVNLTNGIPLPSAILDYLACDATMQPVWMRDNVPVGVGRSQRIVPDRLRRLVDERDQGCRVPGCTNTHVEVHHIVAWADGGATESWNLLGGCPKHHRDVHTGKLSIEGIADLPNGLIFRDRFGRVLDQHGHPTPPSAPAPSAPPPRPDGHYVHPSGERLDGRWIDWTHPNARAKRKRLAQQTDAEQAERLQRDLEWRQRLWDRSQGHIWN